MVTMPPEVTASSGIDVATHAIEAFVSTEASPISGCASNRCPENRFWLFKKSI